MSKEQPPFGGLFFSFSFVYALASLSVQLVFGETLMKLDLTPFLW